MHRYSLCWRFLLAISTTVSCIYLCCYSGEGKAIILLCTKSQLQCWNCHNFLKTWVLILKCSGPNTQCFLRLLPWCMLSTSESLIWVSSSRQKAEARTMTLSQGEELSSSIALAKPSTEGPLCSCLHLLSLLLQGLSMTQEAMQMPCALSFIPALLAPLALPTPRMEKAKRLKNRQFRLQHLETLGGIGKPLSSSNTLYSLSLASSQHHLLTVGGTPPPHLPVTAQKAFFASAFSGGCEKRAGSPNDECWRLHDQQQQELQFPVSEVLAMSTVTVNTFFRYSDCQNFKPSSTGLVPFHKFIIQSYWMEPHMDGKTHVQAASILPPPATHLPNPCFKVGKLEGYQRKVNCKTLTWTKQCNFLPLCFY